MSSQEDTDYRPRTLDDELDFLLGSVSAIAIEGPRGVGKTATALRRARTVYRLDDPAVRSVIEADPERTTTGPPPILIDEWQRLPETWDLVRRRADSQRTPGQFLMTGSASPRNPPTHTGAGRIVSLRMRSMTLAERGLERPTVSLARLLEGHREIGGTTAVNAEQYAHEIVASGFPGLRGLPDRAVRAQLDGYLERVIDRDFEDAGTSIRDLATLRRWLRAYAAAVSTTASLEKIRDAATGGRDDKPTRVTTARYLETLERLWLVEPVPAWAPSRNLLSRLGLAPRHQMADPALAARLRGATTATLMAGAPAGPITAPDATLFGALFESQVTHDVMTYAQAAEARVHHFRSRNGTREIDLIVERSDQRVVALEVKLSRTVREADVRHLVWLRDTLGHQVIDTAVVTTGPDAYRRPDGVAVIPAALLGP